MVHFQPFDTIPNKGQHKGDDDLVGENRTTRHFCAALCEGLHCKIFSSSPLVYNTVIGSFVTDVN